MIGAVCVILLAQAEEPVEPPPPPPAVEPSPVVEPSPPERRVAPRFDAQGELVLSGDVALGIAYATHGTASETAFVFTPGIDLFVLDHVSVGAEGVFDYDRHTGETTLGTGARAGTAEDITTLGGGARVGVDAPLGRRLSWWPRVSVGYESVHYGYTEPPGTFISARTQRGPYLSVYAPLLLHPAPHAFVGFGPGVDHVFVEDSKIEATTISLRYVLGTWWGGADVRADDDAQPVAPAPRFGTRGQTVLTNESGAFVGYTSYSSSAGSVATVDLDAGADHFVIDHLSVGGFVRMAIASTTSTTYPGGTQPVVTTSGFHLAAMGFRVGGSIPLGSWLSLYPRASIAAGGAAPSAGKVEKGVADGEIFVPLLFHPTNEGFVGVGPTAGIGAFNPAATSTTTIGASMLVGAVL